MCLVWAYDVMVLFWWAVSLGLAFFVSMVYKLLFIWFSYTIQPAFFLVGLQLMSCTWGWHVLGVNFSLRLLAEGPFGYRDIV